MGHKPITTTEDAGAALEAGKARRCQRRAHDRKGVAR